MSPDYKEALALLAYAVRRRKAFTVITGEIGTGKTTLVQTLFTLLNRLDGETRTAYISNPKLDAADFLRTICDELEIPGEKGTKRDYLARLQDYLLECYEKKINVVLIIDEAQSMGFDLLEEVRLLSNLETPQQKLLQIILLGQPELDAMLNDKRLRALKQRISVRYQMKPLNFRESFEYIQRRMRMAGSKQIAIFDQGALRALFRYTRGLPRMINIVSDNALLHGYASDRKVIDRKMIRGVIRDLEGPRHRLGKRIGWFGLSLAPIALLLVSSFLLGEGEILRMGASILMKVLSHF